MSQSPLLAQSSNRESTCACSKWVLVVSHICWEIVLGGIDREGLFCQSPWEFMWSFSHSHRKVKVFRLFKVVPFVILFFVITYKSLFCSWIDAG